MRDFPTPARPLSGPPLNTGLLKHIGWERRKSPKRYRPNVMVADALMRMVRERHSRNMTQKARKLYDRAVF